jgi:oxygen-independent coproporphyrinogen-3 oxidase
MMFRAGGDLMCIAAKWRRPVPPGARVLPHRIAQGQGISMSLTEDMILRHAARPVPRYTSYPTAPHFHPGIDAATYASWLAALPDHASLSLYLHVPFCDTLCWFCGCHTRITRRYAPIEAYLGALTHELMAVAACAPPGARVTQLHWGGGSPTILSPTDIRALAEVLQHAFSFAPDAEFAVEVDPRGMDETRIRALAAGGLTRVSIGVQDFDPAVQAAINRHQGVEETRRVVDAFRAAGVPSLNIDAMYGLPEQHMPQLIATLQEVVRLDPDRIALFGYAHVPWMKRHQRLIRTERLPGVVERHAQAEAAAAFLVAEGFQRIGIDHFAKPSDPLAVAARTGRLRRNFQGYTVDPADALIGIGASAIGRLPQGYVQNDPAIGQYQRRVQSGRFATVRGIALSDDDRMRAEAIERLMCDLSFSHRALRQRFGAAADHLADQARAVLVDDHDALLVPTDDGFLVSERGRPFLRTIAARLDAYLAPDAVRHSVAV